MKRALAIGADSSKPANRKWAAAERSRVTAYRLRIQVDGSRHLADVVRRLAPEQRAIRKLRLAGREADMRSHTTRFQVAV